MTAARLILTAGELELLGLLARPAPGVRLSGSGHLAVVFDAMTLSRDATALVPHGDRWSRACVFQNVISERQRGLRQFQASRRAVLGHRLRAGGNERINLGEDVFEGLQAGFIDWHTPIVKQGQTKSKR